MRQMILSENLRADGRSPTQIRPIFVEMSPLPRTHGSALFTRGETQALAVCTLGSESMAQRYEDLGGEKSHRFYLQYFFNGGILIVAVGLSVYAIQRRRRAAAKPRSA